MFLVLFLFGLLHMTSAHNFTLQQVTLQALTTDFKNTLSDLDDDTYSPIEWITMLVLTAIAALALSVTAFKTIR